MEYVQIVKESAIPMVNDGQMKYLKQTLSSINAFLLSLMMSYVGSQFKLLRMSWYRSMKLFQTKLNLVINTYLCIWNEYFPEVYSSSNDLVLSGISNCISS